MEWKISVIALSYPPFGLGLAFLHDESSIKSIFMSKMNQQVL